MISLRGRFDGQHVVLDQPPPSELRPNTPVDVVILTEREQALREMTQFLDDLWKRPAGPPTAQSQSRHWTREELYERGGESLS